MMMMESRKIPARVALHTAQKPCQGHQFSSLRLEVLQPHETKSCKAHSTSYLFRRADRAL